MTNMQIMFLRFLRCIVREVILELDIIVRRWENFVVLSTISFTHNGSVYKNDERKRLHQKSLTDIF